MSQQTGISLKKGMKPGYREAQLINTLSPRLMLNLMQTSPWAVFDSALSHYQAHYRPGGMIETPDPLPGQSSIKEDLTDLQGVH